MYSLSSEKLSGVKRESWGNEVTCDIILDRNYSKRVQSDYTPYTEIRCVEHILLALPIQPTVKNFHVTAPSDASAAVLSSTHAVLSRDTFIASVTSYLSDQTGSSAIDLQ
jgi:hypothetical protein